MDPIQDPSRFSVILFIGNYECKLLDIVPTSWITKKQNALLCQYPGKKEYSSLHKLVQQQDPPTKSWKYFKVSILQEAKDYEQAVRRMERLRQSETVSFTTDEENVNPKCRELVPVTENTVNKLFGKPLCDDMDLSASSSESSDDMLTLPLPPKKRSRRAEFASLSPSPERLSNAGTFIAKRSAQKVQRRGKSASPSSSPNQRLNANLSIAIGSAQKHSHQEISPERPIERTPSIVRSGTQSSQKRSHLEISPERPIERTPSIVRSGTQSSQKRSHLEISPERPIERTPSIVRSGTQSSQKRSHLEISPERPIERTPSIVRSGTQSSQKRSHLEISPEFPTEQTPSINRSMVESSHRSFGRNKSYSIPAHPGSRPELHNVSAKLLHDMICALQQNIFDKISSTRLSLAYDLKKAVDEIKSYVSNRLDDAGTKPVINAERELQMTFPIKNDVEFREFDSTLQDKAKEALMVRLMTMWSSEKNYNEAVANILSRLLSKEVQILYSGAGKFEKQGGKKNYSETYCYKTMEAIIMSKFGEGGCNSTLVRRITTKYLAGADDRKGGRKERQQSKKGKAAEKATEKVHDKDDVAPTNMEGSN